MTSPLQTIERGFAALPDWIYTTIARVARFLREEKHQGYRLVLDRLQKERPAS